jgi:hypothetical protein
MSATGVFAVLLTALVVDWMSIGPNSVRDRLAFLLALPAIRVGWDGSPLDQWTVQMLTTWIDEAKRTGNSTLAQASTSMVLGVAVAALAVYCVGCLLPERTSVTLGDFARHSFTKAGGAAAAPRVPGARASKYRLNTRLWLCAIFLGMLADLPGGLVGTILRAFIDADTKIVAPIPNFLFGVG